MDSDNPVETDTDAGSSSTSSSAEDSKSRRPKRSTKRQSEDREYTTTAKPKDDGIRRSSKRQKRAITITPQLRSSRLLKPETYTRRASTPASIMSEVITVRPELPPSPHTRQSNANSGWPSHARKRKIIQDDEDDDDADDDDDQHAIESSGSEHGSDSFLRNEHADDGAKANINAISETNSGKSSRQTSPIARQRATPVVKTERYDQTGEVDQDSAEIDDDIDVDGDVIDDGVEADTDDMKLLPQLELAVTGDDPIDDDDENEEGDPEEGDEGEGEGEEEDLEGTEGLEGAGDDEDLEGAEGLESAEDEEGIEGAVDEEDAVDQDEEEEGSPSGTPQPSRTSLAIPVGEDSDGAASTVPASQPGRPVRRLPGRRRAPHADPRIEAAIRRQLHLRMRFRAVMKGLKPVLAELAQRSLNELDTDPDCHVKIPAHATVKAELDARFEKRVRDIEKAYEWDASFLDQTLANEENYRQMAHDHARKEVRAQFLHGIRHDLLKALRDSEKAIDKNGHASEDEGDGVIPALRQKVRSRFTGVILGPEYDSRSRVMIETQRHCNDQMQRLELMKVQDDFLGSTVTSEAGVTCKASFLYQGMSVPAAPFATFDPSPRINATVKRNLGLLVQACEAKPSLRSKVKVKVEEQTEALQILADLSMRRPKLVQGDGSQRRRRSSQQHMPRRGTFSSGGMPRMMSSNGRARSILNDVDEGDDGRPTSRPQQQDRNGQNERQICGAYQDQSEQAVAKAKSGYHAPVVVTTAATTPGSESSYTARNDNTMRRQGYPPYTGPSRDILSEAEAAQYHQRFSQARR